MHHLCRPAVEETNVALRDFVQERWKGVLPVISGPRLRQLRFNELIYRDLLNIEGLPGPEESPLSSGPYHPPGPYGPQE
jgi:hypothetical protein